MKLNLASVQAITGNSIQVVVYGLSSCKYDELGTTLEQFNYKVDMNGNPSFQMVKYDQVPFNEDLDNVMEIDFFNCARKCKAIITSLIIENYRRSQTGETLIPLIFCVGMEVDSKPVVLNIKKISESHNHWKESVTDEELRRCYKMYKEAEPHLKEIIEKTLKFVKILLNKNDTSEYLLEEIKPFWEDVQWESVWNTRTHTIEPPLLPQKKFPWRTVLSNELIKLSSKSNLFNVNNNCNNNNLKGDSDNSAQPIASMKK